MLNTDTPSVQPGGATGYLTVISKAVPAGTYAVNVKMWVLNLDPDGNADFDCRLLQNGNLMDISDADNLGLTNSAAIPLQGVIAFGGGTLSAVCQEGGPSNDTIISDIKLSAIQVGSRA